MFLENVPGLLSHDKGRTFATILNALDEIGYDVSWTVLNSANFGVPQARKRVYITGFLRGKCAGEVFTYPDTNPKTIVRRVPGSEGQRVYAADGVGITLTASGGGGGGHTGLYLIPLPVKSNTKDGYQFAFPNAGHNDVETGMLFSTSFQYCLRTEYSLDLLLKLKFPVLKMLFSQDVHNLPRNSKKCR